jgi:glutathione S-transferase
MNYRETGAGNLRAGNLAARDARGVNVAGVSRIYHIATRADWEQAQAAGEYTRSSVDKTLAEEGFIHASQAVQVARTANKFYRDVPGELLVLVIDAGLLRAEVRYEDVPGAELPFPHIYGPLNTGAVIAVRPLAPGPDGNFTFDATG